MSRILYPLYAIVYIFLLLWSIKIWQKQRSIGLFLLVCNIIGLFYENLALSIGIFVGESTALYQINFLRFILHGIAVPLLIFVCYEFARHAGYSWANTAPMRWVAAGMSLLVIALGMWNRLGSMQLEHIFVDGIHRYTDAGVSGPPIATIFSVLFVGIIGYLLWRHHNWQWLWWSALSVFLTQAIPVQSARWLIGAVAEILFTVALIKTALWVNDAFPAKNTASATPPNMLTQ
ncbi:MAG: hypothetical protein D6755_10585 [Anaerolineae bacterium]|nr:MAG: hypothetical protein D6755_10585 [Anaerolineae bacterium]